MTRPMSGLVSSILPLRKEAQLEPKAQPQNSHTSLSLALEAHRLTKMVERGAFPWTPHKTAIQTQQ